MDFKWFLLLIYCVAKLSAFFFISIDFKTFRLKSSILNVVVILLSFGFNLLAMINDYGLPFERFTHSIVMEIFTNAVIRVFAWAAGALKLLNLLQNQKLHRMLENFRWLDSKVKTDNKNSRLSNLISFNFSAKNHQRQAIHKTSNDFGCSVRDH